MSIVLFCVDYHSRNGTWVSHHQQGKKSQGEECNLGKVLNDTYKVQLFSNFFVKGEKEFQTLVGQLVPPPATAARGSGILRSSSLSSTAPSLSLSLGMRKISLSLGRLELHLFTSFLDSRSVGCSSTVRKERGLEKVDTLVTDASTWIQAIS